MNGGHQPVKRIDLSMLTPPKGGAGVTTDSKTDITRAYEALRGRHEALQTREQALMWALRDIADSMGIARTVDVLDSLNTIKSVLQEMRAISERQEQVTSSALGEALGGFPRVASAFSNTRHR
jgi:uncharacterized protein YhaN